MRKNYHQARKQRELAKKVRQQEKQQRRMARPSAPASAPGAAPAPEDVAVTAPDPNVRGAS
jgi:hypothetical protein